MCGGKKGSRGVGKKRTKNWVALEKGEILGKEANLQQGGA